MSTMLGYTPTDPYQHSMTLMQAFAYRNDIDLAELFAGEVSVSAVACVGRIPSPANYDKLMRLFKVHQHHFESLRDSAPRDAVESALAAPTLMPAEALLSDWQRAAPEWIYYRAVLAGRPDIVHLLKQNSIPVEDQRSLLPAALLAALTNTDQVAAMRVLLTRHKFHDNALCFLPLAATTCLAGTAQDQFELIEGLPAYAFTLQRVAARAKPTVRVDDDAAPEKSDAADNSVDVDVDSEEADEDDDEDYDDCIVADDEAISVASSSSTEEEIAPSAKRARSDEDDDESDDAAARKRMLQARRAATAANSEKTTGLPFAGEEDCFDVPFTYRFDVVAAQIDESVDPELFAHFDYWLRARRSEWPQCKFYVDTCTVARNVLQGIGRGRAHPRALRAGERVARLRAQRAI